MNKLLADSLDEIADIGRQIAALTQRSKDLRIDLQSYYQSLSKLHDGETGIVYLKYVGRVAFIKPVRKDGDEGKIIDFTVTFADCVAAGKDEPKPAQVADVNARGPGW